MRLDPSSVFVTVNNGTTADFTDKNMYTQGIDGIYANTEGTINFTDANGTAHVCNVLAGSVPPICGNINITETTADLLVGIG